MTHVLIVDPHPIVRVGLELALSGKPDFKVAGTLDNGLDIFDFVKHHDVDVIISEIDLPKLNGITAIRSIKKEHKSIKILMFSHYPENIYALSVIKAGASGYLNKTASINTIETAIKRIHSGGIHLSKAMAKLAEQHTKKRRNLVFKKLSTREFEVLKLLSIGKKNKAIAKELNISEKTVSTYKARLFKKLNVDNIVDLVHQSKFHNLT